MLNMPRVAATRMPQTMSASAATLPRCRATAMPSASKDAADDDVRYVAFARDAADARRNTRHARRHAYALRCMLQALRAAMLPLLRESARRSMPMPPLLMRY